MFEGNTNNVLTGAIGSVLGIFSNLGGGDSTESQNVYYDGILVPESEADKTPYVFAGGAFVLIVIGIILLLR